VKGGKIGYQGFGGFRERSGEATAGKGRREKNSWYNITTLARSGRITV